MARIRTIKPEFPQSEKIGKLSRDARLLYIQLWTLVDDAGRARAASRMLAGALYPYDDEARDLIDGWLNELEQGGHIRRYELDGSTYLEIIKWLEHQKIDKPSKSRLPEFRDDIANSREPSRTLAPDLVPSTMDLVPSPPVAKATRPASRFPEFWAEYPKRDGDNPRAPAEKKFDALVKSGVDPQSLIDGARQSSTDHRRRGNFGTPYVPQAIKWLNDKRWIDAAATAFDARKADAIVQSKFYAKDGSEQLEAWDQHKLATTGKRCPRDAKGGWLVDSEWPPGYVAPDRLERPPDIPQVRSMQ